MSFLNQETSFIELIQAWKTINFLGRTKVSFTSRKSFVYFYHFELFFVFKFILRAAKLFIFFLLFACNRLHCRTTHFFNKQTIFTYKSSFEHVTLRTRCCKNLIKYKQINKRKVLILTTVKVTSAPQLFLENLD